MPDEKPNHVGREELRAELRALHNRFLLYLGVAVGLIRFDLPTSVTVGALALIVGKAVLALVFRS